MYSFTNIIWLVLTSGMILMDLEHLAGSPMGRGHGLLGETGGYWDYLSSGTDTKCLHLGRLVGWGVMR